MTESENLYIKKDIIFKEIFRLKRKLIDINSFIDDLKLNKSSVQILTEAIESKQNLEQKYHDKLEELGIIEFQIIATNRKQTTMDSTEGTEFKFRETLNSKYDNNKSSIKPNNYSSTKPKNWNNYVELDDNRFRDIQYTNDTIENAKYQEYLELISPEENNIDRGTADVNKMLGVAITTIILLAREIYDIPIKYYVWTEVYLKMIKDRYGNHPPNVNNLLAHIASIKEKHNTKWNEYTDNLPNNVKSNKPLQKHNDSVNANSSIYQQFQHPVASSTLLTDRCCCCCALDTK